MKRKNVLFYAGLIMTVLGVLLFFSIVRVGSFSFFHMGRKNIGPVLLVLWCVILALFVYFRSVLFELLLTLITIALIIVIILNVRIYVVTTSMLRFMAILALIFGGAALMIREGS
ncbi:MAG: hypothetical protein J5744_08315 [Oscillospiraceae bacterium]|nr:hypothetical protein [Oscillospiraceae bacterium]